VYLAKKALQGQAQKPQPAEHPIKSGLYAVPNVTKLSRRNKANAIA
jgi:hypothetical protein